MPYSVREFRAQRFRSLKAISYPLSDLDVFVGANGVGKTNLYRGLELLRSAAANTIGEDLAREGGLDSAMWAGPRHRTEPARLCLGVGIADPEHSRSHYRYEIEIGFPPKFISGAFPFEPDVKEERILLVGGAKTVRLVHRDGASIVARGEDGRRGQVELDLLRSETVLGRLENPGRYPELDALRRTLLQWRFYHDLRTDSASPIRRPCPAVATASLASDGSNLASVFATLRFIREDTVDLDAVVNRAFPGAKLDVPAPEQTASFGMRYPEFPKRVFGAHELSDGTLRFLALAGALLAYRLPPFMALNEPEASLHPDLMEPLAELVVRAAERTQIWLVTHSTRLADAIAATGKGNVRVVRKAGGATEIEGLKSWGEFADTQSETASAED